MQTCFTRPSLATGKIENFILNDLFETLLTYDKEGKLVAGVAGQLETKDNQRYTFHLRKNTKWSDGTPLPRMILFLAFSALSIQKQVVSMQTTLSK